MSFSDIIIVGPTSSGKSRLANCIASHLDIPVVNCDSVQVYKELDAVTNKPEFLKQEDNISFTLSTPKVDYTEWNDFEFKVIFQRDENKTLPTGHNKSLNIESFNNIKDLIMSLEQLGLFMAQIEQSGKLIRNYLFDIKTPLENYSLADWRNDIFSLVEKDGITSKIIAGGTLYYAYHYIFGTEFDEDFIPHEAVAELRDEVSNLEIEVLINELNEKDPEALKLLDLKNKQRLAKAVEFIRRTQSKFSEKYYKKMNILDNFVLIMISPKDKEKYYSKLDRIVENRITVNAFREVEELTKKYGTNVKDWLGKVSYEYNFIIKILEQMQSDISPDGYDMKSFDFTNHEKIKHLISELKLAERHYTKRQMTFMRKLERDLQKYYNPRV
jgi:tRNA A37 N6-isopentenylltransferase MiaA